MMVVYLPVKSECDWAKCFRVRVRKQKCGQTDGQKMDKKWTNERMDRKMDKRMDRISPILKGT